MIVQIYEIRTPAESKAVVDLGVDHVGMLVGKNKFPGEINYDQANAISEAITGTAQVSALSLSQNIDDIRDLVKSVKFDILHLGAHPDKMFPQHIFKLKDEFPGLKITQVIPVIDDYSIEIAKRYDGVVDYLLLDSFRFSDSKLGATGETHDWNISLKIVRSVKTPVILAGGLGPENIVDAIRTVHPAGVDSKTRTDTADGTAKDLEKVRLFVAAVRAAA